MRNVLVTGGSRGLGLAICVRLASAGYCAIAVARSQSDALNAAAQDVARDQRGALRFHAFDLMQTGAIGQLVKDLRREHGPIYGLVNNAGIGTAGVLATMRDEQIEQLARLNMIAPIILTKHVVRSMLVQKEGRIINISSVVSLTGYSGLSVYSATKASLHGFTRSLAREVGRLGINVNTVAPGFIETDMTHEMTVEDRDRLVRRSALRRLAQADDVASAVEYLIGDGARNITGTMITVDAGSTA